MDIISANKDESNGDGQSCEAAPRRATTDVRLIKVKPSKFWLLSIGVYLGLFLSMMDASIVSTALHSISLEFNVLVSVNWVALAYTLAECSCGVFFARVSDVIGRKSAFLAANVLFFGFSMGCAFSRNLSQLVAFRALQGVGGAGLYSLSLVILPEVCPEHLMEIGAGLCAGIVVVAFTVGPILGGILTQYCSWRWIFWINGPICAISTSMLLLFWPKAEDTISPSRRRWQSFDLLGSILVISSCVLIVFAFQNVGVSLRNIWGEAVFVAPVAIGLVSILCLFSWTYLVEFGALSHHKIIAAFPLSLFQSRSYTSGVLTTLLLGFPVLLTLFSVPLRAQIVSEKDPLTASLALLPMLGASAVGCVLAVLFNFKKAFPCESMTAGAILSVVGCALLTTVYSSDDDAKLLAYLAVLGLGTGLAVTVATLQTALVIPPRNHAPAQGIVSQARVLGGSFGIAMSSVLLHNEITRVIAGPLTPELWSMLGEFEANLPPELRVVIKQSCARAFRQGMLVAAIISGVAVLTAATGYSNFHPNPRQYRIEMVRAEARERQNEVWE